MRNSYGLLTVNKATFDKIFICDIEKLQILNLFRILSVLYIKNDQMSID